MVLISVAEAAERLGVSSVRVRQRIADGSLKAERVGGRWVMDAVDVKAAAVARPLSDQMARWVLAALAGDPLDHLEAGLRARAREYRNRVVHEDDPVDLLRAWFRNADRPRYLRAAAADIDQVRADSRVRPAGVSHPDAGFSAPDFVELRIDADRVEAVIHDWFLVDADPKDANVIIHAADLPDGRGRLALELSLHDGPREKKAARDLLRATA